MRSTLALALVLGACGRVGFDGLGMDALTVPDGSGPSDGSSDGTPPPAPSLVFMGFSGDPADQSSYTFADRLLGPAAADRHVLVAAHGRSQAPGFAAAAVTVSGAQATRIIASHEGDAVGGATSALFIVAFPDGETADITVTYQSGGAGERRCGIAVWSAYGLESEIPHDAVAFTNDNVNPAIISLNIPEGGIAVTSSAQSTVVLGSTSTWIGLTEDYESNLELSLISGASASRMAAESARTVQYESTDGSSNRLVAGAFR